MKSCRSQIGTQPSPESTPPKEKLVGGSHSYKEVDLLGSSLFNHAEHHVVVYEVVYFLLRHRARLSSTSLVDYCTRFQG